MRVHIGTRLESEFHHLLEDWLDQTIELGWGLEIENPEQVIVLVSGRPTSEQIGSCSNLKKLIVPFAGIPAVTLSIMQDYPGIEIHNLHHNAIPAAEMAIALMLAAAKFIIPFDNKLREGDWSPRYEPPISKLLFQKTVLIAGYGEIGKYVAKICLAMGMKVLTIRKSIGTAHVDHNGVLVYPVTNLENILPTADILINTLPLTDETVNFFDKERLTLLPAGCLLVNIGRAQTIHEEALYNALCSGQIGAAGFDVWYNYPENTNDRQNTFPSNYPIHKMENVVLSPHRAGATIESEALRYKGLAEMLNQYFQGKSMPNQIDIARGY